MVTPRIGKFKRRAEGKIFKVLALRQIRKYCKLNEEATGLLKNAMERLSLSARAYDRILKVARTIADLESFSEVLSPHIGEAIQYRSLDREGWMR